MSVSIADITIKLCRESKGNLHDINHFLKVCAYAKCIGEKEGLEGARQLLLEMAAVLHDIACPLCREKYGNTAGHLQELEGPALVEEFIAEFELERDFVERLKWLVGHHHTYSDVELLEHRILLEADFLVNADEGGCSREQIEAAKRSFFRTKTGLELLTAIYLSEDKRA